MTKLSQKPIFLAILSLLALAVPSLTFASIDANLKYGAHGQEVKELQEFLIDKGLLTGSASGNFFSLTNKAVLAYQTSVGLPSTGFVGPMTREKINAELVAVNDTATQAEVSETGTSTSPTVTISPDTKALQSKMAELQVQLAALLQAQKDTAQATQQIAQNTAPVVVPAPTQTFGSVPVVVAPVKNLSVTGFFRDPRFLTADGLTGQTPVPDGGNIYISSYLGAGYFQPKIEYTIDGVVQSQSKYPLKISVSPIPNPNDTDYTIIPKPGMYTYTFTVDGISKNFTVNALPDPTNCKNRNLELCIGEYQATLATSTAQ